MYVIISIQPTNELIEAQTTHSVPWHTHTHTHTYASGVATGKSEINIIHPIHTDTLLFVWSK